jgi:xanthine dehydrogenase accessory factor
VSLQSDFAELARSGGRGALVTVLQGAAPGTRMLIRPDGAQEGSLGDTELERAALAKAEELLWAERSERLEVGETLLFIDVTHPPPRLIVFGAVDYSAWLATFAKATGWRCYVVDPRGRFATRERFPDADDVIVAWPKQAFDQLGGIDKATYIAVLTHDPKLDDAALEIALRSEAAYVGAMGSRRAQEARRERLTALGMSDDEIGRLAAPIGLDLGALTAEETALSVMAEVVAIRNGRSGGRLSEKSGGRIHKATA